MPATRNGKARAQVSQKRVTKPRVKKVIPAPVTSGQVNKLAMRLAMKIAGQDRDRVIITGRRSVVVVNHPGDPLPGKYRATATKRTLTSVK